MHYSKILTVVIVTLLLGGLIYHIPNSALEILTFMAVVVALFRERLLSFLLPPVLKISLADNPEHFAIVEGRSIKTGEFVCLQASMGIIIENFGFTTANNVMVYFSGVQSNCIDNFNRHKSIPMRTSWTLKPIIKSLHRNVPIRLDLGYIDEIAGDRFNFLLESTPGALGGIKCERRDKSTFQFEVMAVCDNSNKVEKERIEIEFGGNFTRELNLKIIK